MRADFGAEPLRQAAAGWGAPKIVNTDQGNQLSGVEFVAELARIGGRAAGSICTSSKGPRVSGKFLHARWRKTDSSRRTGLMSAPSSIAYSSFHAATHPNPEPHHDR